MDLYYRTSINNISSNKKVQNLNNQIFKENDRKEIL